VYPIEIVELHKSYGDVKALQGLSFSVESGEIYGLLGPNGAGKTTTLKILVGLLKPDRGTAKIYGYDVVSDRVKALSFVGYIPENPVAFQNLTVKELLEFIGSLRGIPKDEVYDAMEYYLDIFNLKGKQNELISSLSRGMLQKVLATAAFIVKPKVLIMDEPMAGMDPEAQHVFKEEVRKMVSQGVTALISSHLLDMVEKFCTKVGIIHKGRLIAEGGLEEIKRKAESGEEASLEDVFLKLVKEK